MSNERNGFMWKDCGKDVKGKTVGNMYKERLWERCTWKDCGKSIRGKK